MIDIRLLQDASHQRSYAAGQRIVAPDPGVREFYIVISGRVERHRRMPDGTYDPVSTLGPGNSFGERAFFAGDSEWAFQAGVDTVVYAVTEKLFKFLVLAHPEIAFELLKSAYSAEPEAKIDNNTEGVRECTPENYNPENALKAREAFREKFKGMATAATPASSSAATPATADAAIYPADLFPPGYKGYPNVTKPDYVKYLHPTEYKCPNCGKKFEGPKVLISKLVPTGAPRYDLRKMYKGFAMEWYEILTCPHCYFSMFEEYFISPKALSKQLIAEHLEKARSEMALDFHGERTLDFVFAAHFIALRCVDGYAGPKHLNMRLWAGLSWLFEDAGDEALMREYAKKSAQASESIYTESTLTPVQEQIMLLSTAGMMYRTGETDKVSKWLFDIKTMKNGKKTYADLAENLMEEIRAQKAKA